MAHPRVVNVRHPSARWDVYVGRGRCPATGVTGRWGNPFSVREHGRAAIRLYIDHLAQRGSVPRVAIRAGLAGKVLGCWCAPGPCHAEVLARLADGEQLEAIRAALLARVERAVEFDVDPQTMDLFS